MTDLNLDDIDFTQTTSTPYNVEVLDGNSSPIKNTPDEKQKDNMRISDLSTNQGSDINRLSVDAERVSQIKSEDVVQEDSYTPGDTLHEPIMVTFMRDVTRIYRKTKYILKLNKTEEDDLRELNDWDLWGPFLLCLILSW